MTRLELEHAIRAACDVARDSEVYVFGSQSILGQYPDAPPELRQSAEADVAPKNKPENADAIDGVLGELSTFHATHGFYVHGLTIEAAMLAPGWEARAHTIQNRNTRGNAGICLEAHDLAASKLAAGRPKDRDFVRVLLRDRLVDPDTLVSLVRQLSIDVSEKERWEGWVLATHAEVASEDRSAQAPINFD
jgi:hypothetical protein